MIVDNSVVLEQIAEQKIIAIIRRIYDEPLMKLSQALYEGGIRLLEITFDQADPDCVEKTGAMIAALSEKYEGKMLIGGGTVLTKEQVEAVASNGGRYVISPNADKEIIEHTKKLGLVSIPGAMTPTEIIAAHNFGADIVKVFPAGYLGLKYLKDLKGPISHIKLLATAGVNENNFREFLDAGYLGAGISGRLTERAVLEKGDFAEFTARAKAFCKIAKG